MSSSQAPSAIEPIMSADSTDSSGGRRRKRNFFSLINVDCISLGSDFPERVASHGGGYGSVDELDVGTQPGVVMTHDVTCFICLQDFEGTGGKHPLLLHCGHNVCADCEGALYHATKGLRCPVCTKLSSRPHAANAELIKTLSSKDVQKQRRVCAECGVGKIAVFCADCVLPLCSSCDASVHTAKPFMKHKRNKTEVAPMNRVLLTKCRLHFEELTDYCVTCGEVLCSSCVNGKGGPHDDHDVQRLTEVVPTQRDELTRLIEQSEEAEEVIADTLDAVDTGLEQLLIAQNSVEATDNSVARTKREINSHFDAIIAGLQTRRAELLRQVDAITEHKVTSLKSQQAALSQLLTRAYLAACRGRITTGSGSNIAIADSFTALKQHMSTIVDTDMSATAMHEPVVDFLVPEFHGPEQFDINRISQYGAVGGPRAIQGLTGALTSVGSHVRLRWDPVRSRGRHVARSIEIHMSVKGTARVSDMPNGTIVRSDSYEPSDDEDDAETRNLMEYVHEYHIVGEASLSDRDIEIDVSKHNDQWLYFRVRVVDTDMNLTGPWSDVFSIKTPRKFGTVLQFRSPFDDSGLLRYLGSLDRSQWVNPILCKAIVVTASTYGENMYRSAVIESGHSMSKVGWLTAPYGVQRAAGFGSGDAPPLEQIAHLASVDVPTGWTMCTEDAPGSWICLDIGPDRLLKVTHYCLRNGAAVFRAAPNAPNSPPRLDGNSAGSTSALGRSSSNLLSRSHSSFSKFQDAPLPFALPGSGGAFDKCATLRSWHLQGRVREGGEWVTLSVHTRVDKDLLPDIPYIASGWPVSSKLGAYRFFRILQTGRNSIGNDVLSIAGFELYGTLF